VTTVVRQVGGAFLLFTRNNFNRRGGNNQIF
jgi:hypothetical protein